jgi:branched-chain amino acid transport system substrate-binding protein
VRSVVIAAGVVVALVVARTESGASAVAASCERPRIGFMGPLTGDAAFIGKEQLGFARYAVRRLGGGSVRLVETDTQLDPARAAKVAAQLHAQPDVLAVVGPADSREVLAVAPVFKRKERLPFVSGSALHHALTNGSIPSFFRVAPSDRTQAPTIAAFLERKLRARTVVVVDDRSSYSRQLASGVETRLRARGLDVKRESVSQRTTDFGSLVSRIDAGVDVVFLPWQVAATAQELGEQLRAAGKQAVLFGSDALDSGDFRIQGSYVASFAPDIRAIKGNTEFVAGYGAPFVSNFGPVTYVAAQAAIGAIRKACADGRATRAEVERNLDATSLRRTVLGRPLRFTPQGAASGARFSVFRLAAGGRKTMVG